jgi:hypothetical protein
MDGNRRQLMRLEFALVQVAVFFAPFSSFHHPAIYITLSDVFFILTLLLRVFLGVPLRPMGSSTGLWFAGVVMMTGGLFVSSAVVGDPLRGVVVGYQYVFSFIVVPFILLGRSRAEALRLMRVASASMFVLVGVGAYFYAIGHTAVEGVRHMAMVSGGGRMTSFVDNPNGLAALIALYLPILLFLLVTAELNRLLGLVYLVMFLVGIVLTSSNTGLGLTAVGVAVFLAGTSLRTIATVGAVGATTIGVVLQFGHLFLPATFVRRVFDPLTSGDIEEAGTFGDRAALMEEAWGMVHEHLVLGLGANQYRLYSEQLLPVHNTFLIMWTEGGLVMVLGYLIALCAGCLAALGGLSRPHGRLVFICTAAVIAITAAHGMATTHYYARYLMVPILVALGPAVALGEGFPWAPPRRLRRLPEASGARPRG